MAQQQNALEVFQKEVALHEKQFTSMLPQHIPPKRFMRTVVSAAQANPDILSANRQSVLLACQKAAQDGLIVDNREAALVLFGKTAAYMPMVYGILKKLRNSGQLASITAQTVHKNDAFKYNPAMDDVPNHSPEWFGERGEFIGVYAVAKLSNGEHVVEIMNKEQVEKVRKVSRSGDKGGKPAGIWAQWYEEMAKKTVIRRIAKMLPSTSDIDQMFSHDNETFDLDGSEITDVTPQGDGNSGSAKKKTKKKAKKKTAASRVVTGDDGDDDADADDDATVIDGEFSEAGDESEPDFDGDGGDDDPI